MKKLKKIAISLGLFFMAFCHSIKASNVHGMPKLQEKRQETDLNQAINTEQHRRKEEFYQELLRATNHSQLKQRCKAIEDELTKTSRLLTFEGNKDNIEGLERSRKSLEVEHTRLKREISALEAKALEKAAQECPVGGFSGMLEQNERKTNALVKSLLNQDKQAYEEGKRKEKEEEKEKKLRRREEKSKIKEQLEYARIAQERQQEKEDRENKKQEREQEKFGKIHCLGICGTVVGLGLVSLALLEKLGKIAPKSS